MKRPTRSLLKPIQRDLPKLAIGALLCSPLGLLPAPGAWAQSTYINQVREQLLGALVLFGLGNYTLTHEPYINHLNQGYYRMTTLTLQEGRRYTIIGVCDEDCGDLDLILYDGNGNTIDVDESSTDYPIVEVMPRWTGNFYVRADMYQCSVAPCYYGVGVFAEQ